MTAVRDLHRDLCKLRAAIGKTIEINYKHTKSRIEKAVSLKEKAVSLKEKRSA
jgi:hypothetical protein